MVDGVKIAIIDTPFCPDAVMNAGSNTESARFAPYTEGQTRVLAKYSQTSLEELIASRKEIILPLSNTTWNVLNFKDSKIPDNVAEVRMVSLNKKIQVKIYPHNVVKAAMSPITDTKWMGSSPL